jgi:hypothetical protein
MVRAKNSALNAQRRHDEAEEVDEHSRLPSLFHDMASEDEGADRLEAEEDDEDEAEEPEFLSPAPLTPGKWKQKDKKILKSLRHFAYNLIQRAAAMQWEEEQLVDLVDLVRLEMDLDHDGVLKLLEKTESASPNVFASLADRGMCFLPVQLLSAMLKSSRTMDRFISTMGQALEYSLFDLKEMVNEDGGEGNNAVEEESPQSVLELVSPNLALSLNS